MGPRRARPVPRRRRGRAAAQPGVDDQAGFFSPQAISTADATIEQIQRDSGRELVVRRSPRSRRNCRIASGRKTRSSSTSTGRTSAEGPETQRRPHPHHAKSRPRRGDRGQSHPSQKLPASAREQLSNQLLTAFKAKNYDGGLIQATEFVKQTMSASGASSGSDAVVPAPPVSSSPPIYNNRSNTPGGGVTIGGLLCVGLAAVVLIALFVNLFRRRPNYPPQGGYPSGYAVRCRKADTASPGTGRDKGTATAAAAGAAGSAAASSAACSAGHSAAGPTTASAAAAAAPAPTVRRHPSPAAPGPTRAAAAATSTRATPAAAATSTPPAAATRPAATSAPQQTPAAAGGSTPPAATSAAAAGAAATPAPAAATSKTNPNGSQRSANTVRMPAALPTDR